MKVAAGVIGVTTVCVLVMTAAVPAARQHPGKAIFTGKGTCFVCHGVEGKGTPLAPDLTDGTWVNFAERPTLEQVKALVKAGVSKPVQHPAAMPPMGGAKLSDAEIAAVSEYILELSPPPGP